MGCYPIDIKFLTKKKKNCYFVATSQPIFSLLNEIPANQSKNFEIKEITWYYEICNN